MTDNNRLGVEFKNYSVSHGTLKADELIIRFSETLKGAGLDERVADLLGDYIQPFEGTMEQWVDKNKEEAFMLLEELIDMLHSIAPKGCYFGAHPGNGSDFGFWETDDTDIGMDAVDLVKWTIYYWLV